MSQPYKEDQMSPENLIENLTNQFKSIPRGLYTFDEETSDLRRVCKDCKHGEVVWTAEEGDEVLEMPSVGRAVATMLNHRDVILESLEKIHNK